MNQGSFFSDELEKLDGGDRLQNLIHQYRRDRRRAGHAFSAWAGKRNVPNYDQDKLEFLKNLLRNSPDVKIQSKKVFNSWAGKRPDKSFKQAENEKHYERERRKPWGGAP